MANPNEIAVHVDCPGKDGDVMDIASRHEAAVNLFTQQCPFGADDVAEVVAIRGRRKKKCAWRVRYFWYMAPQFLNLEQLALDITNLKPNNTEVIEKTINVHPPSIDIVYSCGCRCNMFRNGRLPLRKRRVIAGTLRDPASIGISLEQLIGL